MLHMTPESTSGTGLSVCVNIDALCFSSLFSLDNLCVNPCNTHATEYLYSSLLAASGGIEVVWWSFRPVEAVSPCAREPSLLARRGQVTLGITPAP